MNSTQYETCIRECYTCAQACDQCFAACLTEEDATKMARCVKLDADCSAVCRLAAAYMARSSEFARQICDLCAEVCEECGQECAKFQSSHCQHCASICNDCAQACRAMA
ncbi:four-helix bundle copper-binding protein [Achromobacter denitrificans]|uniref:four-helix bundle copper-binding protein n=2 Tax=Achromobacter TaxID=222 RepID=UPI0009F98661|nr:MULTISPECIES: four-helix bundle copper-binding protein [Achromobacter]ASC66202.1 four-helix bundle copper-binding protein [Achromobacter denitrificans]MCD0498072.1 four-helix bundle copper-binding protein [Achromobacter sp. MY14]MCP2518640.1 four-helix bundle copper-binding protein [Achromobacter mucicolens]